MELALFGYGGHAREVACQIGKKVTFFVDEEYESEMALSIKKFDPSLYKIMIAVADCRERERIVKKLPVETKYFSFVHPSALILDKNVEIGEGCFVGAYSIITTNIKIGNHAILNRGNHIGHDSQIGNYFSAMPGAIISGNVLIGDRCYFGTNSSVKEKVSISDDVIVGSNATVVKNIISSGTYVGIPVKKL